MAQQKDAQEMTRMHSPSKWFKFLGLTALRALSAALVATLVLVGILALAGFVAARAHAQTALIAAADSAPVASGWRPIGPSGGDVISLAADPRSPDRLYLGTQDGHVFTSSDGGARWQLLSRVGANQDDVLTHIIVDSRDSKRLYASTWTFAPGGGGVYRSDDSGRTWHLIGLERETVRALAQSVSDPDILVAGSISGVYRSKDSGKSWQRISPAGHRDLKNFDSVAIDPRNPDIIYAGTYHLPWKTENGGRDWFPVHKGMIDDSDVMSIIIDPSNPSHVHATACSGIYHSSDAAANWKRYSGIPFVFRRTQLIRQDPKNPDTLYAGTTSGLWKSTDDGANWKRVTPGDWVINAIVIDAGNADRVILGTERHGVQVSDNGGTTFRASNNGFHHMRILDVAIDRARPERALVVLAYDVQPFLATRDGGATWSALGAGLKRSELRRAYAAPSGFWASLNSGGLMRYDETSGKWVRAGVMAASRNAPAAPAAPARAKGKAVKKNAAMKQSVAARSKAAPLSFVVNDLAFGKDRWFAATSGGLLVSSDRGSTWSLAGSPLAKLAAQSVETSEDGGQVWAIAQRNLLYSAEGGAKWEGRELPFASAGDLRLHRTDDNALCVTSSLGLYVSRDAGRNWKRAELTELQTQDVAGSDNALLVSLQRRGLVVSYDGAKTWRRIDGPLAEGFFPVLSSRRSGSIVAASATEGVFSVELGARASGAVADRGDAGRPQQ
jgi:photosystem II stability/assembly factor-like uncharacterized protein